MEGRIGEEKRGFTDSGLLLLRKETNFAFCFGVKGRVGLIKTLVVLRAQSYSENILPEKAAPAGIFLLAVRLPTHCP